jgi:hypothetical protein
MIPLIGPIISGLFSIGKSYLDKKGEISQAKHEATMKKISSEADWDNTQAVASGDSWKDELITVVTLIPLVMVFFPMTREYIIEGFRVLSDTTLIPEWYLYLVSAVYASGLGIRSLVGTIKTMKS